MLLNKHGSFYIRNGWPTKIMNAISTDRLIFSPNNELEAVDTIGVGRVMVKAMRYWAVAMGLAAEEKTQQGVACNLTDLGNIISAHDPFCQDKGSLWLLHRNLATNEEQATAWYWAFNVYNNKSFSKEDFCSAFYSYIQRAGGNYQKTAVEKEFDCFKNTYVSDKAFDVHKIIEEDTVPFFAPLRLLDYNAGVFERMKMSAKDIPTDILLYCIMMDNEESLQNKRQLSIDLMLEEPNQVGKYMNLTYAVLLELLLQLENQGYINVINNFGNRHIEITTNNTAIALLNNHY